MIHVEGDTVISLILAAAPTPDPAMYALTFTLAFALVLVVVIAGKVGLTQRKQIRGLEARNRTLVSERPQVSVQHQQESRNAVLFEQHRRMNDLQVAKLAAEVELLERQVKAGSLNDDRIEAGKEYHELLVEKTKLEMDSLRLHIAEVRRRMEDWKFGDD